MSEEFPAGVGVAWAILGAAYAAAWLWLGVRLVNRRERWVIWGEPVFQYWELFFPNRDDDGDL
jgi:hypothetical protein